MINTLTDEYRQLGYETSNDMIRHDARRTDRKYEEAALYIRNAGLGRLRMGQMMADVGDYANAASDWLSAAACFYLVPDLERMNEVTELVRQLDRAGKIPPERGDLHSALKEREEQFAELDRKLTRFREEYGRVLGPTRTPRLEAVEFLLRQIPELPGYPRLYAELSGQAMGLGQRTVASEALEWALRFDPDSPHLAALRASQLFTFGDPVRSAEFARELLAVHPEMDSVRFLLAQAVAFRAGEDFAEWKAADWEGAIEVLQPLIAKGTNTVEKLLAVALAAYLHRGLGHDAEYRQLLSSFDQLASSTQAPLAKELATKLRQHQPRFFQSPGGNGAHTPARPDYLAVRGLFEQLSPLTGAVA